MKGFSTREVAEVLGLPTSTILSWTRSGVLTPERGPKGAYLYSFQDIVLLRAARELLDARVPARRVRAALEALREQLPVGRPLSAVHISASGDRILVRDDSTVWEPASGQLRIDFAVAEVAEAAEPVARRVMADTSDDRTMSADDWYDTALDLEAVSPESAMAGYREFVSVRSPRPPAVDPRARVVASRPLDDPSKSCTKPCISESVKPIACNLMIHEMRATASAAYRRKPPSVLVVGRTSPSSS